MGSRGSFRVCLQFPEFYLKKSSLTNLQVIMYGWANVEKSYYRYNTLLHTTFGVGQWH